MDWRLIKNRPIDEIGVGDRYFTSRVPDIDGVDAKKGNELP